MHSVSIRCYGVISPLSLSLSLSVHCRIHFRLDGLHIHALRTQQNGGTEKGSELGSRMSHYCRMQRGMSGSRDGLGQHDKDYYVTDHFKSPVALSLRPNGGCM